MAGTHGRGGAGAARVPPRHAPLGRQRREPGQATGGARGLLLSNVVSRRELAAGDQRGGGREAVRARAAPRAPPAARRSEVVSLANAIVFRFGAWPLGFWLANKHNAPYRWPWAEPQYN